MEADPYKVDSESDREASLVDRDRHIVQPLGGTVDNKKKKKPFWAPKHIAYVKGLPYSVAAEEYNRVFSDCGEVISITEQTDDGGKWTGSLFVRYASEEDLKNAIAVWNEAIWTGTGGTSERFIKVQRHNEKKASKKKRKEPASAGSAKVALKDKSKKRCVAEAYKVVVSNLKRNVTDDHIRNAFSKCGEIKTLKTSRDKSRESECRGYCHIEYTSKQGMDAALAANYKIRIQQQLVTVRLPGASQSEVPLIDVGQLKAVVGKSLQGIKRKREIV